MLVVADETQQLDVIEISGLAGKEFNALVYGPNYSMPRAHPVIALDYYTEYKNVSPVLNKYQMLCHPIGPNEWVNVAPSDSYNKYIRNCTSGDIIG